jgi:hypothetical protein
MRPVFEQCCEADTALSRRSADGPKGSGCTTRTSESRPVLTNASPPLNGAHPSSMAAFRRTQTSVVRPLNAGRALPSTPRQRATIIRG